MTVDPSTDVAAIERAYVEDKTSVAEILVRFKISKSKLYRLADDNGWPRRIRRAGPAGEATAARLALVGRLYRRFRQHLEIADRRRAKLGIDEPDEVSERDARTLGALARLLEKLIELDEEARRRDAGREAGAEPLAPVDEAHAERIRAELVRRISRLAGSEEGPAAGEAEAGC